MKSAAKLSQPEAPVRILPLQNKTSGSRGELFASRILYVAMSAAALFFVVLYSGYRSSLPEYDELAMLTQLEQKNLYLEAKGELTVYLSEFAQGAQALLSARQKRWLIFPYYDPESVMAAITHLQNAFEQAQDPASRNKYAFFTGKAYLMYEDVCEARQWFNRVVSSDAVAYLDETQKVLANLNKLAPHPASKMNRIQ